jgi:rod shape-determining protein MreC
MRKKISPMLVAVLVFAVFIIILAAISMTGVDKYFPNPVSSALRTVFSPVQQAIWNAGDAIGDNARAVFQFHQIQEENEILRRQVEQLTNENLTLQEKVLEAQRYSEMEDNILKVAALSEYRKISAKIVMRNPTTWYRMLTVNRGTSDGVYINAAVMGNLGLVGKVVNVTPHTADILLLTDGEGQVAALTRDQKGTALFGVVRGNFEQMSSFQAQSRLEMEIRREEELSVGGVVYTSGLGGVYPANVPIGVITEIDMSGSGLMKVAYIEPLADFASLEEVFIIATEGE